MRVFFSLGTNMGCREENMRLALRLMQQRIGKVTSLSAFYVTEPWGFKSDNTFLNSAAEIETDMQPLDILAVTKQIEVEMGRKTKSVAGVYHDRVIDIDLLLCGDIIMKSEQLTLPHPLMTERLFVMEPLAEIAPELVHPVLGQKISEILLNLRQDSGNK